MAVSLITISGTITSGGVGLAGVVVTFNGANSVTTNGSGVYSKSLFPGSYTVLPTLSGYTFTPTSYTGVNSTSTKNFTATAAGVNVSGTVKKNGVGVSGVTVSYSGGSTTTAGDGTYTLSSVAAGTYTLTFKKTGYVLNPTTLSVVVSGSNVTGQNSAANLVVHPSGLF